MPALLYRTHRAEARALSAGPFPLLAVYLAALAGGYRRGRRLARSGDPRPRLALRLAAAAALAAFWLGDAGTLLVFGLPIPELAQVAAYALVGIATIGWLLAECVLLAHTCARSGDPVDDRSPIDGRLQSADVTAGRYGKHRSATADRGGLDEWLP